jgi:hypothetical protein
MKEKGRKKECTDPDARTTAMENERGREIQRERETGKEGGRSTCTGKEGERSTCNTVSKETYYSVKRDLLREKYL